MPRYVLPLLLLLAACAPAPRAADTAARLAVAIPKLPPAKQFSAARPDAPARSNADIARDFLDLAFTLESGRPVPVFTRFEEPITLRVTGRADPALARDLRDLLRRLRDEAGIDIRLTRGPEANITIESVPGARIRSVLPQAACFVVPNVSSLSDYARNRRSARTAWSELPTRKRVGIFLPADISGQEARDCLHEELAQALGPLNDLYRLSDSVFNDDNMHAVLTGFDMLILRAYYAPDLASGMSRDDVARHLPAVLARLNPAGEGLPARPLAPTPRAWSDTIQEALGPGAAPAARRAAAERAVAIARASGWRDHRLAFGHFALGRLTQSHAPDAAREHFETADRTLAALPRSEPHRAFVRAQLAAYAIADGDAERALALTARAMPVASRHENAMLLSTLMLLRAEALALAGRPQEARALRLDSLGWARYGFGPEGAVRGKLAEIAALNPRNHTGG
ncbi:DUF2927 domain-containing protein [Rhodosalinus sp. K401]|uniref:DUF2927 domain-containing protein n=1 Tax=Rhodosalinus sp. K401 TaxID=3239195 RepID=UPI0035261A9D